MEHTVKLNNANSLLMKFFINELKYIYWAEQHLLKALIKMANKAMTDELVMLFQNHCRETENHITRLERVFEIIDEKRHPKKCKAMSCIIDEGESIIPDTRRNTMTRDIELIFAVLKAKHYEIATYDELIMAANTLGFPNVVELLILTLKDEKKAGELLTHIARSKINAAIDKVAD